MSGPNLSKQKLGLWMATALVVGNMIGSGIFLLPSSLAPYGGISIVGWVFTAVGAMMLALVFARLARAFPKTGGPYAYSQLAFGDFVGFQTAWGYWINIWVGNAAIAVAFAGYLAVFWPEVGANSMLVALFTFAILLATLATLIPYAYAATDRARFNIHNLAVDVVVALLAFGYALWAIAGAGADVVLKGTLLFLAGIPIYVLIKWRALALAPVPTPVQRMSADSLASRPAPEASI